MISKCTFNDSINLHVEDSISKPDADRQTRTAKEILKRFRGQPGVILADEVGMGKTFVALAVAVSVALSDERKRPVVVMVPPSLQHKWPEDFRVFQERCLKNIPRERLKFGTANRAVQFLKLLDDPEDRQKQLIFVTHGAMSRGLINREEVWIRLAVLWKTLYRKWNVDDIKWSLAHFMTDILWVKWIEKQLDNNNVQQFWYDLLSNHPKGWLKILQSYGVDPEGDSDPETDDDPVPEAVWKTLLKMDTNEIFDIISGIPKRKSIKLEIRLKKIHNTLSNSLHDLWHVVLDNLSLDLSLLILDEAHHLKNSGTRLASLFQNKEAEEDADLVAHGPLGGAFERMLFLTATPFQLGHNELCNVLSRFSGINWYSSSAPPFTQADFSDQLDKIQDKLDQTQIAARRLDKAWSMLTEKDLFVNDQSFSSTQEWIGSIESSNGKPELTDSGESVNEAIEDLRGHVQEATGMLKPWIIRHSKPTQLAGGQSGIPRRKRHPGASIQDVENMDVEADTGLPVSGEGLLPFLLAARTAAIQGASRPIYAEGLSSSFEAFRNTRTQSLRKLNSIIDTDDENDGIIQICDTPELAWYLGYLDKYLETSMHRDKNEHPKMKVVVQRVADLWECGEKVVVFCHYVQTGKALRQYISNEIKDRISRLGYRKLGCSLEEVPEKLQEFTKLLRRKESRLYRSAEHYVESLISKYKLEDELRQRFIQVILKYLGTDSFLVRYFPLRDRRLTARGLIKAMRQKDRSGFSLRLLIENFMEFLSERCRNKSERENFISAIETIKIGSISVKESDITFGDDEIQGDSREQLVPNVRLVNGATRRETRQTIMKAFNTPFFPEIIIASSVLSEGVDLHLNCRYIIHHDLCWNPSTIEQRTGRVDRIGAKAEKCGRPIRIYLPYISETQDEKMYRVVMDRERWFNVVMGAGYNSNDTLSTEKEANRLPLPESLAKELSINLEL